MYLNKFQEWISCLRDPYLVVRFQRYFGLKSKNSEAEITSSEIADKKLDSTKSGPKYEIENYFWFYLFSFGSKLGYELFYTISFSYCFWNIDQFICRRLMLVWAILMYIGQALKDIIRWPRPNGPDLLILEPAYSFEYGMPSTHAILSLSMPVNLFLILYGRYEFSIPTFIAISISWCSLICCSRIYLGMHSVLDILAGLGLTAILLVPLLSSIDLIDYYLVHHWSSPFVLTSVVIFLAAIYPEPNKLSPSRGDTCVMIGSTAGVCISSWIQYQQGLLQSYPFVYNQNQRKLYSIQFPFDDIPWLALRTIVGLVVIVLLRILSKTIFGKLIRNFTGIDPNDPVKKFEARVEVPLKLSTYIVVGFSLGHVVPLVFRLLHIERSSMYHDY